ncbi:MAG TPA: DUF5758 domain-containing protein [Methylophilaceae bacterium]
MKFEIKNRWNGNTRFVCELPAEVAGKSYGERLGYAVQQAYKSGTNLSDTDLAGAYLVSANLPGADLAGANLVDVDLSCANMVRAHLPGADLSGANMVGANLARANLAGANLADADLSEANSADLAIAMTRILPDGDLIGWKKCRDGVIVKLRIPADARRYHAFGRKCRAEFADVLEVIGAEVGISQLDGTTEYRVGERVVPDRFDDDWRQECAPGIHFFITRAEAEAY